MSDAELPPSDAEARSNRRVWWGLAGVFVLLLGAAAWFYLFYDIPAPDPTIYHYDFKPVPPGENVIEVFARETETLRKAMQQDWTNRLAENEQLLKFEPGCETSLREHVEAHRELLEKFQRLMREAPRPLAYPGLNADVNFLTPVSSISSLQDGANLWRRGLMLEALTGDAATSCQQALDLAEFAKEFSMCDSTLIHWLVMMTMQAIGLQGLQQTLPTADMNPVVALEFAKRLTMAELVNADFAKVIRVELVGQVNSWNRLRKLGASNLLPVIHGDVTWFDEVTFKPNMTVLESVEHFQPLARAVEVGWKDGVRASQKLREVGLKVSDPTNWRVLMHPNRYGSLAVHSSLVAMDTLVLKSTYVVVQNRCLQTALALRAHELETGRRAEKLEQLVPAYLPAIPEDPLTGEPLKWNPQTARLYSVGEDGRDNGGDFAPDGRMRDQPDWGIEYPWH